MTNWTPPPETVTWTLPQPIQLNGLLYKTVTLRAPLGEDILKASALPGSPYDVTCRLIAAVSAEQLSEEAARKIPHWQIDQMGNYFDAFTGAPEPGPLAAWRAARAAAAAAPPADAEPAVS